MTGDRIKAAVNKNTTEFLSKGISVTNRIKIKN